MSLKSLRLAARSGTLRCEICGEKRLLVKHHIHGRDIPFKNRKWNLCWICASCHDEIHSGRMILEGRIMTSEGKKIIFRRIGEDMIAKEGAKPPLYFK